MSEGLQLRSELADFERVKLSQFWQIQNAASPRRVERVGNGHRIELLDGNHREFPEDVDERGYFENDYRGTLFILEALQDPTWETVIWAASMHLGGTFEVEEVEKAVEDFEVDR